MSNNNYFIDGKIKLPYNFEKEKYIIGIEKKSDNTLVGSKTILPIKDALPNNKIEITPIPSSILYFKYEENKFNVVENELKYNINLFIDETPVSMFELNDEDGLVVGWSDKYFIEKTGPRSFKLCLNDNYTSITDTNSVQYTELVNNGVFSESINIYIKYNDLYFKTKIDVLFSKSYFETTSLYDTIDVNSGVSENVISIEGYYNGTKVSKDNLSLKLKEENNSFAAIISTLGYASLKQNKNEWILYCENSDEVPTETNYTVDGNGKIIAPNGDIVKYVHGDVTGEFFDLSDGTKLFLKVENSDGTNVFYNNNKTVIPGINIFDPFNNIKINEATSYDSVNSVIKDTHDRVSEHKDGKYYPLDKIFKTTILNGGSKILYDKNGRLISVSGDTLLLENGLILDGTNILSGNTVVISGNTISNNLNGAITKNNNNAFYYRGKLLYSGGTGYFNEEPVSNICPLITDDNGNVLYNVKKSANKIEIISEKENYSLTFSNNKWIVNGPNRTFTANNIGELIYINAVIGDTNGNLYRRHDLNIYDFKNTHNILDGLTIKEICGDEKEYKPITREEVYFDAHSINDIKKSIPNLYTYLNLYKGGNLPKINIITTCNGVLKDEKEFYLSNNKLNHSSYNIKLEPQVITPSMITNGGTVTAYVVNKSGEFIPFDTYSKNNYSLSYICDGSGVETKVTSDVCTINLTTATPVYNDIKFILKCNDNIVKQEIIEVLGENKFITSVKYIDVTTGANYIIAPTKDFYGNNINWTTGNTSPSTPLIALTISPGDTVQKTLNGYVNGVKVHEQIVIPVKNGSDGESPYTLVLTNTNASINCDSEGNILNGIKMPTCKAILYKGTTEVANAKYTINYNTGVNIDNNNGDLNFETGFTFTGDSLEIVVSATTNSVLRGTAIMTITKSKQGPKGDTGGTGKGISSVTEYYQTSTANTLNDLANNNWSTGITITDSIKKYLWNYEVITYTDNTTGGTNPVIIGTYGDTGKGISSVTEYYQISSANTVTSLTNNWSTGITETNSINKYLWNYEETKYTDGSTNVTTPVIIGTHGEKGDTGASGNSAVSYWMEITPNVLKKDVTTNEFSITVVRWQKIGIANPTSSTNGILAFYDGNNQISVRQTATNTFSIKASNITGNVLNIKWLYNSNSLIAYDTQTIPILKDGEKGERGKLLYPAGRWDSGQTYDGTDEEKTPFVTHKVGDVDKYYVLTANKITNSGDIPGSSTAWTEMAQYEALYTKLLVTENGLVGGSVYNGDYVFSKDGVLSGNNTSEYSGFTSEIVDNIFTGDTPNNNFIPNYLVDFNKGRAWFGGGNTIINEKGIIYSKDIVDIIHELPIPYPSGTTKNGWDRIATGITAKDFISSGTKVYVKYVKNLNVFVYDDYESETKTCPVGFIFLDVVFPEDLFPIQNTWYTGSIIFSNTCPHTKLIRFPSSNVRDNFTIYKPYKDLRPYKCPYGLNVGADGCLRYMYHPAKRIVEIIGSNHKVYENINEEETYDWQPK